MKSAIVVLVMMLATPAVAAETSHSGCFDIVLSNSSKDEGPFLINHCTGQTWSLIVNGAGDTKGQPIYGEFVYVWNPITMSATAQGIKKAPTP
jgi:hypothetical protein